MKRTGIRRSRRLRPVSKRRAASLADYASFRLGILSRDGYRCTYCRTRNGALDLHHVTKRSQGGALLEPDNVVTLCRTCHRWTDAAYSSPEGRLVVEPIGRGQFVFSVVHAANKWMARAAGAVPPPFSA